MKRSLFAFVLLLSVTTGCRAERGGSSGAEESNSSRTDSVSTVREGFRVPDPDPTSARLFAEVMAYARENDLHERPIGEIMQEIGLQFRGKPYIAGMLDEPAEETLICRLDGFDCVTFVETALAMAHGILDEDYSYDTFAKNVMRLRYRKGEMNGYCSRLHYFTDWILDNEDRGHVKDITGGIGGIPFERAINFMTENHESYPRLASNDSIYRCIQRAEQHLRENELFYIPQDRIRSVYDELQAGDIIATTARLEGLDVTHTGLVYDTGQGKGLLHASTSGGVKVSPDLQKYIQNNRGQIGIFVARPLQDF